METVSQPLQGAATTDQPPITLPEPPTASLNKPPRSKPLRPGWYDQLGITGAYAATLALSGLLWYWGAFFTLAALTAFGITTNNPAWWFLPAGITLVEIWLMPRAGLGWQSVVAFVLVLAFDISTSWYGAIDRLAGELVPLGPGFRLPTGGIALHIGVILVALALAFIPEKLGRWSVGQLVAQWRRK